MRERPILFNAPMVRAILDGRKTQTRRAVRPQPRDPYNGTDLRSGGAARALSGPCPYGAPGDRLWVRETFNLGRPVENSEGVVDDELAWIGRLPKEDPRKQVFMSKWRLGYAADGCEGAMRPSIHMPRWASRITLEVTCVRVERLQDITESDARAEGAAHRISPGGDLAGAFDFCETPINYRAHFRDLWDSINGPDAWNANPWVWVVQFRRVLP